MKNQEITSIESTITLEVVKKKLDDFVYLEWYVNGVLTLTGTAGTAQFIKIVTSGAQISHTQSGYLFKPDVPSSLIIKHPDITLHFDSSQLPSYSLESNDAGEILDVIVDRMTMIRKWVYEQAPKYLGRAKHKFVVDQGCIQKDTLKIRT